MKKFVGRKRELDAIQRKFNSAGFSMVTIYGRRRIGKTTLINEFIQQNNCKTISFVAVQRTEADLLKLMAEAVLMTVAPELTGTISFESFEKLFDFITGYATKERIILFIDEYPYLAEECKYMNSLLQKYVDRDWKNTKLFLILCGSLVSYMRDEVMGASAPLHGRSDLELRLNPFDYRDTACFLPDYSFEDKAIVYGLTGGVAKYIDQFEASKSLDENIIDEFFSLDGFFSEEQIRAVVSGDKQHPAVYHTIISAIASGHTKYNEIASYARLRDITYYLNVLSSAEIIEKRLAKKPYYVINDGMLLFWLKYVSDAASVINAGKGKLYYEQIVKPKIHDYMGKIFENMAAQYIMRHTGEQGIPIVNQIEEYQTQVKKEDGKIFPIELDIVGRLDKQIMIIGECKFKNEHFDKSEFENFLEKIKYMPVQNPKLIIFSKSGFSKYVKEQSMGARLVTLEEMY